MRGIASCAALLGLAACCAAQGGTAPPGAYWNDPMARSAHWLYCPHEPAEAADGADANGSAVLAGGIDDSALVVWPLDRLFLPQDSRWTPHQGLRQNGGERGPDDGSITTWLPDPEDSAHFECGRLAELIGQWDAEDDWVLLAPEFAPRLRIAMDEGDRWEEAASAVGGDEQWEAGCRPDPAGERDAAFLQPHQVASTGPQAPGAASGKPQTDRFMAPELASLGLAAGGLAAGGLGGAILRVRRRRRRLGRGDT